MATKLFFLLSTFVLISGLSGSSLAYSRYYYFVNKGMIWSEAQSYCRANYTDLATVDNMDEMKQLMKSVDPKYSGTFWIGLNKVHPWRWGWSSGEISQYRNWNNGEPNGGDRDGICGAYSFIGWFDADCDSGMDFICYNELNGTFIHINKQLSWRSAQDYCRHHYTDLATIHNDSEHQHISDLLGTMHNAWIGLFFDNWKWSDQQNSTFRYWEPGQPWNPENKGNCVAVVMHWNGRWDDTDCNDQIPFICYKVFSTAGGTVRLLMNMLISIILIIMVLAVIIVHIRERLNNLQFQIL